MQQLAQQLGVGTKSDLSARVDLERTRAAFDLNAISLLEDWHLRSTHCQNHCPVEQPGTWLHKRSGLQLLRPLDTRVEKAQTTVAGVLR